MNLRDIIRKAHSENRTTLDESAAVAADARFVLS